MEGRQELIQATTGKGRLIHWLGVWLGEPGEPDLMMPNAICGSFSYNWKAPKPGAYVCTLCLKAGKAAVEYAKTLNDQTPFQAYIREFA